MPAPPGATRTAGAHLIEQGGSAESVTPAQRVSSLMKEARGYRQLDRLSNTRLSTLVNAYVSQELTREFLGYVLGYVDPTGEAAVRNVMRERTTS